MAKEFSGLARRLATGAVLAVLCMPANAAEVGIGGLGGASVDNGGASANVGGTNGATASVSLGGSGANAAASVVGTGGATASIGTSGANIGIGTGTGVNAGVNVGTGTNPTSPSTPSNQDLPDVVADMSNPQLTRMKKRCVEVLNNEGIYDRELRQLCLLISRR